MAKIIAVANQKGGVGKTTTTVNMAAGLVKHGYKVLCVDLDPQANMSDYLAHEYDSLPTISKLMQQAVSIEPIDVTTAIRQNPEGISYIPSDIILSSADVFLATAMCREQVLKRILSIDIIAEFDYVLIDCLPSLGILLTNALTACNSVVIPVEAEKFAYVGLAQLQEVIRLVQQNLNPTLSIAGVLLTMADKTTLSKMVHETLAEQYHGLLFGTVIHRRTEAGNSTVEQRSMVSNPNSFLGAEYSAVVEEFLERGE